MCGSRTQDTPRPHIVAESWTKQLASALGIILSLLPATLPAQAAPPRLESPFTATAEIRPADSGRPPGTLRIASWNIEWFPAGQRQGAEGPANLQTAAAAHLIHQIKPDILAVQEIRNLRALQQLNRNLSLWPFSHLAASWFHRENTGQPDERIQQQAGLLSRIPWEEVWEIDFGPLTGPDRPPRGWLGARFRHGTATFTLYTGHLKSDFGADSPEDAAANRTKRRAAIEELARDLERRQLDPYRDRILVAADFNADFFLADREKETLFGRMEDLGFSMARQPGRRTDAITVPAREGVPDVPDLTLDYLYFSSGWGEIPPVQILAQGASKKRDVFGGDGPGLASDHYPIYADVTLPMR